MEELGLEIFEQGKGGGREGRGEGRGEVREEVVLLLVLLDDEEGEFADSSERHVPEVAQQRRNLFNFNICFCQIKTLF